MMRVQSVLKSKFSNHRLLLSVSSLLAMASGCATPPTPVVTDPPGAFVSVNGSGIGPSPINYTFDFGRQPAYQVTATKPGYFDSTMTVDSHTPNMPAGPVNIGLQQNEAFQVTTTTNATNQWLVIQVSGDLKQDEVWQKLVNSVTTRYNILEQMDYNSGYLRSVAISRNFKGPQGDFSIRTQFLGTVASKTPLIYKIKIVSEQSTPSGQFVPYDRVFKEDAQLIEELQSVLQAR